MPSSNTNEFIEVGIKKSYFKIESNRITYKNGKSYNFNDPEEKIRASLIAELIDKYKYPIKKIDTEVSPPNVTPNCHVILLFMKMMIQKMYLSS